VKPTPKPPKVKKTSPAKAKKVPPSEEVKLTPTPVEVESVSPPMEVKPVPSPQKMKTIPPAAEEKKVSPTVVKKTPPKETKRYDPRFAKILNLKEGKKSEKPATELDLSGKVVRVDAASTKDSYKRLHTTTGSILEQIMVSGKPTFEIPSRSSSNIIWDEMRDLLLLGDKMTKRSFHSLSSVLDATRLMRIIEIVDELLLKDMHATKREIYYKDVDLFEKNQKYSDKSIEDLSAMLKIIRNSTHIVASAKGACIGRLKIRDTTTGHLIDLEKLGTGGWSISPFLDRIEIVESDAEFILVVEKDAALIRLSEAQWWNEYPCIILTGKGSADIATRMFLRLLAKELNLPCFCLVDSDPYGHYIYSVYLRGSKRLSYESPFLATPKLNLIGVLSRDLDQYKIPDNCRLKLSKADRKRTEEIIKEPFVQRNFNWVEDLELMLALNQKAEIQALSVYGFEYLTESYLPTKLSTGDWI
jgi:DNA topoisomerase VI subunit A